MLGIHIRGSFQNKSLISVYVQVVSYPEPYCVLQPPCTPFIASKYFNHLLGTRDLVDLQNISLKVLDFGTFLPYCHKTVDQRIALKLVTP